MNNFNDMIVAHIPWNWHFLEKFHGKEYERLCVCENNLCNAEMSPIPETTSTTKSTTTDGI